MTLPLVVEQGNSPVIQTQVRDNVSGLYISDAAVQVTVTDMADVPVAGQVWPMVLPYILGTQGIYRNILEDDVQMIAGNTYKAVFDITVGSITRHLDQEIFVTPPTGDVLPATSPASPAYEGPSLQTRLNEAEAAYHRLLLGGTVTVVVDQNGERVEYAASNMNRLAAYIQSLKVQLGLVTGRPLKVYYS